MKTITINLYSFNELDVKIQKEILLNMYNINVMDQWWDFLYSDAAEIGLIITGHTIHSSNKCTGKLKGSGETTARLIIENHGKDCATYKLAVEFLNNLPDLNPDEVNELEADFTNALLNEYAMLLVNEYDYLTSDEAIIETIEANEYTFEKNGKMRNS